LPDFAKSIKPCTRVIEKYLVSYRLNLCQLSQFLRLQLQQLWLQLGQCDFGPLPDPKPHYFQSVG